MGQTATQFPQPTQRFWSICTGEFLLGGQELRLIISASARDPNDAGTAPGFTRPIG